MSRRFLTLVIIGVFLSAALIACEDDGTGAVGPSPVRTGGQDTANVRSKMDLSAGAGFFDAPFPIEHMRRADGTVRYAGFPNPEDNAVLDLYLRQADGMTQGFSRAGSIYLPFEGAIDTSTLPSEFPDSLSEGATIFLVNVQSDSARYGERLAFTAVFQDTAVTHIPKNVLKILPFQGTPMEPEAMYAAVVLATQNDATGKPLAPSIALQTMRDGGIPAGKYGELNAEAFGYLWDYCEDFDIDPTRIAAATVFRTGEFESEMRAIREAFAAWPDPAASDLKVVSEYDTFYVVEG
ncbi:hypothetical protein KDL45_04085, partial [bacterium]|nr:hypothetical protein [bacterium]